jgi:hypothetical protein
LADLADTDFSDDDLDAEDVLDREDVFDSDEDDFDSVAGFDSPAAFDAESLDEAVLPLVAGAGVDADSDSVLLGVLFLP